MKTLKLWPDSELWGFPEFCFFCFLGFGVFLPMFTDVSRLVSLALNQECVRQKNNTENSPLCCPQVPRERSRDVGIIQQKC